MSPDIWIDWGRRRICRTGFYVYYSESQNTGAKNYAKIWNKKQGFKGDDLLDDIELSFIKEISDYRKKGNTEKENAKDLFCKCLPGDLNEMSLYERLNAKNEIRGIIN